ncbi:hypothetical protein CPB84DRAFT_1785017 [Gymnopilus junonius]|uniref:Uncharacterized protein n=1 Tax=Gymnopilus junonius TaxID=109634 RepID=A0A9P5NL81_GYMJU|nr:hypothetical protein CPB84DRAFT_1785017 [Gymnopilus junonius]
MVAGALLHPRAFLIVPFFPFFPSFLYPPSSLVSSVSFSNTSTFSVCRPSVYRLSWVTPPYFLSICIQRQHEFTHYLTKSIFTPFVVC